ncbi:MAG: cupin domain-containing protein [Planctomycetota bacterium]
MDNLLDLPSIPRATTDELVTVLAENRNVRIERIVSNGHASPANFWYDQDEHEWVAVLQGEAKLLFGDGDIVHLTPGSHVLIPAHTRHRVQWTEPATATVWLAVFYRD